jgi:hypothetical protein
MERLLRAGHWQFFVAGFVVPFLLILSGLIVPSYYFMPAFIFFVFPLGIVMSQLVLYLWMWSVTNTLFKREALNRFFDIKLFRFFIIAPVVIIILILVFWFWGAAVMGMGKFSMADILTRALFFVIPVQLLFVISKFYCFYFTSKIIKSAEMKKAATFDDALSLFILIIVFPIGIWLLQPRVNRLVEDQNMNG